MNVEKTVELLEEEIGYKFKNSNLLLEAVTHSSYANEMKINKRSHYERLEFLGDAVLELLTSEFLFEKYPSIPEGGLSKKRAAMVCEPSLAKCARLMHLGDYMFFGKGEEAAGGRERDAALCDVTEAILGAIYLDGGLDEARRYVREHVLSQLSEGEVFVDNKTALQELVQKESDKELLYEVTGESGPEHDKTFTIRVSLGGEILSEGSGHTKKAAQQDAARKAIECIKNKC